MDYCTQFALEHLTVKQPVGDDRDKQTVYHPAGVL